MGWRNSGGSVDLSNVTTPITQNLASDSDTGITVNAHSVTHTGDLLTVNQASGSDYFKVAANGNILAAGSAGAFYCGKPLQIYEIRMLGDINCHVDGIGLAFARGATFKDSGTNLVTLAGGQTITPMAAPAAPASGWTLYVDSGDGNKLKAKASTGTVVTLGTP